MRLRLRSFLLTSALTFVPAVASATTISGLYVDGGAGYNNVQDQHVHANGTPNGDALPKFSVNHGTGYTGFGAIGYGFGNGLRVEAEGLYNSSEDNYTQNVEENNATNNGEQLQYLKNELQGAQTKLNDKLSGISTPSNPEYGQGPTYTPTTTSTYKPGTPSTPGALPNVPGKQVVTVGGETYYTEKNSSTIIPESVDSLKNLSKQLTQDQDEYKTYQTQVGETTKNYDDYQSQVNTDVQEAQKASTSYQQDQQKAETSYKNYQNQVASATQAARNAYQQYQETIQQLMQANPKYKTLIESYEQQAEQSYNNYQNGLDQESQQVETSYNNYQDKLQIAMKSSTKNQDELKQALQEAKNAYQDYQDQVKQFETKYPNYQDQLKTVGDDISQAQSIEEGIKNEGIIDIIPFNAPITSTQRADYNGTTGSYSNLGLQGTIVHQALNNPTYGQTKTSQQVGCDSTYSWCGAFGGAPVVVIQKIDELPQWAAPSKNDYDYYTPTPAKFLSPNYSNGWQAGIIVYDNADSNVTSCSDCYYISTLTPEQALQLEQDGASAWDSYDKDNGLLPGTPPLSQQTMTIPSTTGTGSNTTQVPVEGPPLFDSPNLGYQSTGGGATRPNATYLGYSEEAQYVQKVMQDLSTVEANAKAGLSGGLPQGFYYFQGNIGVPSSSNPQNNSEIPNDNGTWGNIDGNLGQVYKDYPNQQGYDNIVNKLSGNGNGNDYYPYINPKNPGVYGYPEPTPLPTQCTSAGCTLNVGSTWFETQGTWTGDYPIGDIQNTFQAVGVVDTISGATYSNPCGDDTTCGNGSISNNIALSPHTGDRYNITLMRAAALLATPSRPESSVSSMSHSISDFRDALFVTPRSGSKVLSVPHASLMSYGFPMRSVSYHGRDQSYGGFANVLYDFDLERLFGLRSIVTPFVGGGAGYLWQRYDDMGPVAAASITGVHGGFAWQGIAGVAFDTGISGLQITAQYRMIGQPGSFYNGAFNYGTEGGHANFDQRFNHQFIVGFRYAFHNQPVHITPPSPSLPAALAAAAAPAPVPARSYLVFFDWNQYALTSRARQIVVEAAHATSYVHTTRINVNGYTDSSAAPGPAGQKYNYALSVKRARSVEAELIRNGVPASEIVIRGYGDSNPLVPTGPNTREPQNRRVEIILHA